MRRLVLRGGVLLVACVALCPVGCKRKGRPAAARPAGMLNALPMNDPGAEAQLESGFYGLESGSWRWAGPVFALKLMPPPNAAAKGAELHLNFTIPDAIFAKTGPMTVGASVNTPGVVGMPLQPEHYAAAGTYDYARDIDAGAFPQKGPLRIEFTVDKSIPPEGGDKRELSLIVSSVSLEPR